MCDNLTCSRFKEVPIGIEILVARHPTLLSSLLWRLLFNVFFLKNPVVCDALRRPIYRDFIRWVTLGTEIKMASKQTIVSKHALLAIKSTRINIYLEDNSFTSKITRVENVNCIPYLMKALRSLERLNWDALPAVFSAISPCGLREHSNRYSSFIL